MRHDKDLADQDVEELAEEIWTLGEEGRDRLSDLRASTRVASHEATLDQLVERGLAAVDGERLTLTVDGRRLAGRQVRRHRLAETLFTSVLEVADEEAVDRTACVMEHVLSAAITDSVCAFLGHPTFCPHGKPIPAGPCCHALSQTVEPLVQPLDQLSVGEEGRIVYIAPREPSRLVRLSTLGIAPGVVVHVQQKLPATIIRVGETTLAVEPAIAGEIYVKRVG